MHDGGGWFYGSSGHMIMHIVLHMLSETMTIDRHKRDFLCEWVFTHLKVTRPYKWKKSRLRGRCGVPEV